MQRNLTNTESIMEYLKDENHIEDVRHSDSFKASNRVWNTYRFNARNNIGDLMEQIKTLNPENKEQWYQHYLNPDFTIKNDRERGRSVKELNRIAERFDRKMQEEGLFIEHDPMEYVLIRTLYETYQGYQREEKAMEALQTFVGKEFKVVKSDREEDVNYNVDCFLVNSEGEKILGLQIKSEVFQKAYHNDARKDVTQENQEGFKKMLNKDKIPSVFLFADKNGNLKGVDYIDRIIELSCAFYEYNKDGTSPSFDNLSDKEWDKFANRVEAAKDYDETWKVFVEYEKMLNRHMLRDSHDRK